MQRRTFLGTALAVANASPLFAALRRERWHDAAEVLERAMAGRLDDADATAHFGGLNLDAAHLRNVDRLIMTACGTSFHAGLVGEYLLDQLLAGFFSKVTGWRTSRESVGVPPCDIDFVQFTGGVQDRRGRLV